jgi:hypothetical protein
LPERRIAGTAADQHNAWWDVCKARRSPFVLLHPRHRYARLKIDLRPVPEDRCPDDLRPLFDVLTLELRKASANRRTALHWGTVSGTIEHLDFEFGDLAAQLIVRWLAQP